MELEYKPDIEDMRERWAQVWRGEVERPMLQAIRLKHRS